MEEVLDESRRAYRVSCIAKVDVLSPSAPMILGRTLFKLDRRAVGVTVPSKVASSTNQVTKPKMRTEVSPR